jgi:catechol 2,3-dioxygenase-like lactoylglutathione lyase family enzyme
VREFGGYLRVPLTRAAIVEDAAAAPPLAPSASPRLAYAILYVASVARSRQFYADAFGLREAMSVPPGDPAPTYCELETGATRLALCAFELAASNFAEGTLRAPSAAAPPANCEIGLVVPDVHAAFKRAVAAGAAPAAEPRAKDWGQLVSYVRDLDGHLVELCS